MLSREPHDAFALPGSGREPQLRGDGGFHLFGSYAQDATRLVVDEAALARTGVTGEIILNDLIRRFPGKPDLGIRGSEQDDYRDLQRRGNMGRTAIVSNEQSCSLDYPDYIRDRNVLDDNRRRPT